MSEAILTSEVLREAESAPSLERRALVVEDDPSIRSLVIAVLRRQGFAVDAVGNGREALALLGEDAYSIFVFDLTMPEMNGVELIEYLRHRDPRTLRRIVVITASVHRTRPDLPPEICQVLTKPFDLTDLHAAIESCATDVDAE
jgi:CheY-like chemotaxis protein